MASSFAKAISSVRTALTISALFIWLLLLENELFWVASASSIFGLALEFIGFGPTPGARACLEISAALVSTEVVFL